MGACQAAVKSHAWTAADATKSGSVAYQAAAWLRELTRVCRDVGDVPLDGVCERSNALRDQLIAVASGDSGQHLPLAGR